MVGELSYVVTSVDSYRCVWVEMCLVICLVIRLTFKTFGASSYDGIMKSPGTVTSHSRCKPKIHGLSFTKGGLCAQVEP